MHKEGFIYTLFWNCTSIQSNVAFNRLYILEFRVELTMNHTCRSWLYFPFFFMDINHLFHVTVHLGSTLNFKMSRSFAFSPISMNTQKYHSYTNCICTFLSQLCHHMTNIYIFLCIKVLHVCWHILQYIAGKMCCDDILKIIHFCVEYILLLESQT